MDKTSKVLIKQAVNKLPADDVKKLQELVNDYRLSIGDLRVLFSVENDIIIIKDVLLIGQAYKKLRGDKYEQRDGLLFKSQFEFT